MKMGFLFTSESVSEGHPDKVSDQISDAILDEFLRRDANSKVACETLCTTGLVVVAGEVRSEAYVDVQGVARRVINRIGYTRSDYQFDGNSCGILSAIHEQSSDINQGVVREAEEEQGAGDQLAALIGDDYILHVNPTGKFVIGGPHGDTGLTGRKIIVDTYGGRGAHGGGAFSGKDSSKVDRSAAYAARHIAKNLVAAGVADQILVELSYAIGIAQPLSIYVDTYNSPRPAALAGMTDGEIARRIGKLFDLRPAAIVKRFGLKNPIFEATASYGHFGNRPYTKVEKVWENGVETEREIEFFGWEKLDAVEQIKREFGL